MLGGAVRPVHGRARCVGKQVHQVVPHRSCLAGVEAFSLLSERHFPRHAHDHYGIGIIAAGAQTSWSGAGKVESVAGDAIMVNPGEVHDGVPLGGARGWRILYLEPALVLRDLADDVQGDLTFRPVARDPVLAGEVTALLASLHDAAGARERLLACLARIVRQHRAGGGRPPSAAPPVARAREWIDAAPEADVPLAELARACDVSRFQLIRGFLRDVGTTPHAYRLQLRVRRARRYLAEGRSVAEAALLCGFADQSHLTRAFARQFGLTPGRYRAALMRRG
jgi:AraC-like DNA-binding protein